MPGAKVDIGGGIEEDALAMSFVVLGLSDVGSVVGIGDLDMVVEISDSAEVVILFVLVLSNNELGVVFLHFNNFNKMIKFFLFFECFDWL